MHYYSIEWHTHTTHSDADQTIDQLFAAAAAAHYDILSISDHNTLSAYAEIQQRQLQPASQLAVAQFAGMDYILWPHARAGDPGRGQLV